MSVTAQGCQLLSVMMVLLLTACTNTDMDDLQQYIDEVKSRKQGRIEPLPEIKQIDTFAYNAADRRNPFFLPKKREEKKSAAGTSNGLTPNPSRRKEELESFPLNTIRMVGTLGQKDTTWGLLQTTDGIIHTVKAGNYAGMNHGQITRISEEKIELTEIIPDGQGGYREQQTSLRLIE